MFESPKEMFELVEKQCGRFWAKAGLWAVVLAAIFACLLVFGTLAYHVNERMVKPLLPLVPSVPDISADTPPGYQGVAVVSLLVTSVLLAGTTYFILRRFKTWRTVLIAAANAITGQLGTRIETAEADIGHLAGRVANIEGTLEFHDRIREAANDIGRTPVRRRSPDS